MPFVVVRDVDIKRWIEAAESLEQALRELGYKPSADLLKDVLVDDLKRTKKISDEYYDDVIVVPKKK
jgi:hypothetical protein